MRRRREHGQILVLFALSLVAVIATVGLVLDGGSVYAQRRSQQNAADLAALAAANDYLVNHDTPMAATARRVAATNGYTHAADGVTVDVGIALTGGARVKVDISAPHQNNFAGIVGMPTWTVGTTATALTGFPDTAVGPGPFILSRDAFGVDGKPLVCDDSHHPCSYGHPVTDEAAPQTATEFVWTNFGLAQTCTGPGNVDNTDLRRYLEGVSAFTLTLQFGCYIGQHNQGVMNDVVSMLNDMLPVTFPIPVVNHNGNFVGWVSFELTGAVANGRNGVLQGYFRSPFEANQLTVVSPSLGNTNFAGSYVLKLVD